MRAQIAPEDHAQAGTPDRPAERGRARPRSHRADEVPDVLTRGLRERDGAVGRTVLVYPEPGQHAGGAARPSPRSSSALRDVAQAGRAGRRPARVAGGPRCRPTSSRRWSATGRWRRGWRSRASSLTVLLMFRRGLATPFVIGSLVVGVAVAAARATMRARHQDQLRQLHRLPDHLRHRRRLRRQRDGPLPARRRPRRRGRGARHRRRRRRSARSRRSSATRRCWSRRTSACSCSACWPCWARSPASSTAVVGAARGAAAFPPAIGVPRAATLRMGQGDRRDGRRGDAPAGAHPDLRSRVVNRRPGRGPCGSVRAWKGDASAVSSLSSGRASV